MTKEDIIRKLTSRNLLAEGLTDAADCGATTTIYCDTAGEETVEVSADE